MAVTLPPHAPGQRIGLFGGSFNPPHEGHLLVAETALRRLKLDRVWWLVTPGNPLKETAGLPSQEERMAACRRLIGHDPRIVVTGIEAGIGTRYTQETIAFLKNRAPGVRFVWLMGSDNLADFHRWRGWTDIMRLMPVAVIARPGSLLDSRTAPAAARFAGFRIPAEQAGLLPNLSAPAWTYLTAPLNPLSSTKIRTAKPSRAGS